MKTTNTPTVLDAQRAVPNTDGTRKILRFGDGLMLWIGPRSKTWRCKVMRAGKQTTVNLGAFPEVSIKEAKAKRAAIHASHPAPPIPPHMGIQIEQTAQHIMFRVAEIVREELARFAEGR